MLRIEQSRKRFFLVGIFTLFILTMFAGPVMATWIDILYENFEQDIETWPWQRNGHTWTISNYPPPHPIHHTWGVEDSAVFYNDHPDHYRAAWCSGLADNLIPGVDDYMVTSNRPAVATWGAFSLEDAVEAEGNFRIWADVESNANGTGDDFYFLVSQATDDDPNIAFAYDLPGGTEHLWPMISFDMAFLDSSGEEVSYIGRDGLSIHLYFEEDGDVHRGFGVFIDNIALGYDNGMYDYLAHGIQTMEMVNDSYEETDILNPGLPYYFNAHFTFAGPNALQANNEVWHYLYINDEPFDSVRSTWENSRYGEPHEFIYETAWVPADTGLYRLSLRLDDALEQEEDVEDNNIYEISVYVSQPQTAPTIEFISPSDPDSVELSLENQIIYIGHNSPDIEPAYVSFFYTQNPEDLNTGTEIPELRNIFMPSGIQRTSTWEMNQIELNNLLEGRYYIIAVISDGFFPAQVIASEGYFYKYDPENPDGVRDYSVSGLPEVYEITGAYPNPFNPTVEINVSIPQNTDLTANWYSIDGRLVDTKTYQNVSAGYKSISWSPENISSGVYFLRLNSISGIATTKVIYVR